MEYTPIDSNHHSNWSWELEHKQKLRKHTRQVECLKIDIFNQKFWTYLIKKVSHEYIFAWNSASLAHWSATSLVGGCFVNIIEVKFKCSDTTALSMCLSMQRLKTGNQVKGSNCACAQFWDLFQELISSSLPICYFNNSILHISCRFRLSSIIISFEN